ncbi:MAG: inositol monophosphatase [Alphaproteobacteria bacterium 41-28]|nr:MAG: inositol monophosphatase [Alphaproteobacteria bacterium 41-28]
MVHQFRAVSRSPHLNVMCNAAFKAARGLVRDFGEVEHLQVSRKGPGDFVSTADKKAEDTIYKELKKARPSYGFVMEEGGEIAGEEEYTWIIDPLDGTTNFLHGIPHFAISIGLQKGTELIAGVIYDPIKDELFYAEKGGGAFLNERRLRVSARHQLQEALLATGIPFASHSVEVRSQFQKALQLVMPQVAGVRRFGAAALDLAYVAAGRYEGYWERSLMSWDIAAGIVLVREAGGYVCDLQGGDNILETRSILATNQNLQQPLKDLLLPVFK